MQWNVDPVTSVEGNTPLAKAENALEHLVPQNGDDLVAYGLLAALVAVADALCDIAFNTDDR